MERSGNEMSFSRSAQVAEKEGTSKGGWAELWEEVLLCFKFSDSFGAAQILDMEATELADGLGGWIKRSQG